MLDRKRSLVATLLVASALSACGKRDDGWDTTQSARYCVDQGGHRVNDSQCAIGHPNVGANAFLWYYLGSLNRNRSYYVPPIGGMASGGGYAPGAGVRYSSAPTVSGVGEPGFTSVARGGFGGTGEGFGGGGE